MNIVYVAFRGHFSDSPRALYEELVARGHDVVGEKVVRLIERPDDSVLLVTNLGVGQVLDRDLPALFERLAAPRHPAHPRAGHRNPPLDRREQRLRGGGRLGRVEHKADELFDHAGRIEHILADERQRIAPEGDEDAGA